MECRMKIQEIAAKAGVSMATVSRVFNNHPNVRDALRSRVLDVAREYGYSPRFSVKQRNAALVVSMSESGRSGTGEAETLMHHLVGELFSRGYRIEVVSQDSFATLQRVQFSGAIGIGVDDAFFRNWAMRFAVPLVVVDRDVPDGLQEICSVCSDEEQSVELAIGCLAARGHHLVGCIIREEDGVLDALARKKCILKTLKRLGLPAAETLVRITTENGYVEDVGRLLQAGADALFCPGDNGGMAACYALSLYNRRVPADVSLVASECVGFSRYALPPQTTVARDYAAQAKAAVDALDARLRRQPFPQHTVIPCRLIQRDSVK